MTHPENALLAGERAAPPQPEEDVGLPAGDQRVGVGGVELHPQHHLIGRLPITTHRQATPLTTKHVLSQTQWLGGQLPLIG